MLIPDWRKAWRFSSLRLVAFGGVCQAAVMLTPEKVASHVPEPVMAGLSTLGVIATLLAIPARVTRLGKPHEPEPPTAAGGH